MSFISVKDVGITAVSHSRMKTHESCPRKAMYKFIDRLKEPSNEAMDRGLAIHKQLEEWLKAVRMEGAIDSPPVPHEGVYRVIRDDVSDLFNPKTGPGKYDVQPEQQVAFDREWNQVDWFAPNTWMRVVYDYFAMCPHGKHAVVADYKTGKVYDDHDLQADLYAVAAHKMGAQTVDVVFYYLDQNMVQPYKYDAEELVEVQSQVEARAERVTSDRTFPTNPSWRCRYCHFRKENGGPCVH